MLKKLTALFCALVLVCAFGLGGCTNTTPDSGSTPIEKPNPDDQKPNPDDQKPDPDTPDDKIHGWYNYSPNSAAFEEVNGDTQIIPQGTAFGSQVILNYDLAENIKEAYRMSFVLDATEYDTSSEIWISILGAWNEAQGNALRTGLHFINNQWFNVATYGFARGVNKDFMNIVSYQTSDRDEPTATTKKLFPELSSPINVSFDMCYDKNEDIIGSLYLNEALVQQVNYTEQYGADWTFTDVEAVGFDIYCPVKYDIVISQVKVEDISGTVAPDIGEDDLDGWYNYRDGASIISREADGSVSIVAGGAAFGSSLTLNQEILKGITGEYQITFDLETNMTAGSEIWLSLVGAYKDDNNLMRSGLHFINNTWNNVAFYGSVQYGDPDADVAQTGFFSVIWPEGTPDAPATFVAPSLTQTVHVKETYTYDKDENVIVSLYLNDNLVYSYNLNTYYGNNYEINDCTAIGIDCFVSEAGAMKIKNFTVTQIIPEQ